MNRQQGLFLLTDAEEALYGGAVGGGKTAALLMGALQYVDVPGYAALILRRTFPELEQPEGPIWQSLRWFGELPRSIRPKYTQGDHRWTFPTKAVIQFGHLDSADSIMRYQGGGYQYVGFDELTHFEEQQYEFIGFSRQRKPPDGLLGEVPIRVRASANPGGPGHAWVKKRFRPESREEGARPRDRVFIPAKVWDNPGIATDDYVARLKKLNPVLQEQLLGGDWGAFEGRAFEKFDPDLHVVDGFDIPRWWDRFESFDYGMNNPTAWLAWACDNDENVVIFDSHYKPGLPSETAPIILRKRAYWKSTIAYGDPQSLATRTGTNRWEKFGEQATIETEFSDAGLPVQKANNNPRSGYVRLRTLIDPDPKHRFPDWHPRRGELGSPRLFILDGASPELVEQLESAPLQPIERRYAGEMIDPEWEGRHGHAVAALRYGAMSRPKPSNEPDPEADVPPHLLHAVDSDDLRRELTTAALERHYSRPAHDPNLVTP